MESPYTLATRKLARIREENQRLRDNRLREIRTRIPQYAELESELRHHGSQLAQRVLSGTSVFPIFSPPSPACGSKNSNC